LLSRDEVSKAMLASPHAGRLGVLNGPYKLNNR